MNFRHQLLALPRQCFRFLRGFAVANHVDVCTGNKVVRFSGDKHYASKFFIFAELFNNGAHLRGKLCLQGIHSFAGNVNGDDGNIVQTYIEGKSRYHFHYSASRTIAAPSPPAAQAVTKPNPPPRRRSSCNVWVIIRAPVAAKG